MLNILNRVYDQVKDHKLVSKGTEMVNIAREVYSLVKEDRSPSLPKEAPRFENVESLYMEAVTQVTGETQKEVLRSRWDVWTVEQSAQTSRSVRNRSKEIVQSSRKKIKGVVRDLKKFKAVKRCVSLGRDALSRTQKIQSQVRSYVCERAKTCEKRTQAIVKSVKMIPKFVKKNVNRGIKKARKSVEKVRTNLKVGYIRFKELSKKYVQPKIEPITQKLSETKDTLQKTWTDLQNSSNKILDARKTQLKELVTTLSDALTKHIESSKSFLAKQSETYIDPIVAQTQTKLAPLLEKSNRYVTEKSEPIKQVAAANFESVRNLVDFTWVVIKAMARENKQFLEGYAQDVDCEIHYAPGKSFSLREKAIQSWEKIVSKNSGEAPVEEENEKFEDLEEDQKDLGSQDEQKSSISQEDENEDDVLEGNTFAPLAK